MSECVGGGWGCRSSPLTVLKPPCCWCIFAELGRSSRHADCVLVFVPFGVFLGAHVLVWHSKFIDRSRLINEPWLQSWVNILTAHVLVSLKMGALCSADTTAMTAWRLFISQSFCEENTQHTLRCAYNANIHENRATMLCCAWLCVPWQCGCTDSTPQLWSSTSVRGGSLVPPRNSSREKKNKHEKRFQHGAIPSTWWMDISLMCCILHASAKQEREPSLQRELCPVKSPAFESRAKACRWTSVTTRRGNQYKGEVGQPE